MEARIQIVGATPWEHELKHKSESSEFWVIRIAIVFQLLLTFTAIVLVIRIAIVFQLCYTNVASKLRAGGNLCMQL